MAEPIDLVPAEFRWPVRVEHSEDGPGTVTLYVGHRLVAVLTADEALDLYMTLAQVAAQAMRAGG